MLRWDRPQGVCHDDHARSLTATYDEYTCSIVNFTQGIREHSLEGKGRSKAIGGVQRAPARKQELRECFGEVWGLEETERTLEAELTGPIQDGGAIKVCVSKD